jgi:hypothetical protein
MSDDRQMTEIRADNMRQTYQMSWQISRIEAWQMVGIS